MANHVFNYSIIFLLNVYFYKNKNKILFVYLRTIKIIFTVPIENKNKEERERVAKFAKAMGNPVRITILQFLANQDSCFFGDIHDVLPIAKATVSQHLKELKEAGLIQGDIEGPKVRYCINRQNWEEAKYVSTDFLATLRKRKVIVNYFFG